MWHLVKSNEASFWMAFWGLELGWSCPWSTHGPLSSCLCPKCCEVCIRAGQVGTNVTSPKTTLSPPSTKIHPTTRSKQSHPQAHSPTVLFGGHSSLSPAALFFQGPHTAILIITSNTEARPSKTSAPTHYLRGGWPAQSHCPRSLASINAIWADRVSRKPTHFTRSLETVPL